MEIFAGLRVPVVVALKAVAMFAIGLPMCRIEQMLELKAETVKKLMMYFTGNEQTWDVVEEFVASNFRISKEEIDRVGALPDEFKFLAEPFRHRAFEFRGLGPLERRRIVRQANEIAKRRIAI
jgi:hypothetical protein